MVALATNNGGLHTSNLARPARSVCRGRHHISYTYERPHRSSLGLSQMNYKLLIAALVLLGVEVAVIWLVGPRPQRWPRRFSLLALFVAMTLTALFLGIIAYAR